MTCSSTESHAGVWTPSASGANGTIHSYRLGSERAKGEPRYGAIRYAAELLRDFPNVKCIAGHSGLYELHYALGLPGGLPNVFENAAELLGVG